MDNILAILESPVVLLIAGALIGFIPSYFLNKQNNKYADSLAIKAKRQEAYLEFLTFYSETEIAIISLVSEDDKLKEDIKNEYTKKYSLVQARLALFGSEEAKRLAYEADVDLMNLKKDNKHESLIQLMRKDLGIEE